MEINIITDSEWRIMRVLWEESPLSSSEITLRLKEIKKWGPTTVKTFLSRLVNKDVLRFEMIGRKHMYYPAVTEKECIENEMQNIIRRVYGGLLVYESEHFEFFGDNKLKYALNLSKHLEKKYKQTTEELDFKFKSKQPVYLYKTQSSLHSALGLKNAPSWVRAGGSWGIIHLSPKETFHDEDPANVAVHVFTEILLYNLDSHMPVWIARGVSAYYGGWLSDERILKTLQSNEDIIDFQEYDFNNSDFIKYNDINGFVYSLTVIQYIVQQFGVKTLKQFISNNYDYLKVFEVCKEEFFNDWKTYLKEEYLNRGNIKK